MADGLGVFHFLLVVILRKKCTSRGYYYYYYYFNLWWIVRFSWSAYQAHSILCAMCMQRTLKKPIKVHIGRSVCFLVPFYFCKHLVFIICISIDRTYPTHTLTQTGWTFHMAIGHCSTDQLCLLCRFLWILISDESVCMYSTCWTDNSPSWSLKNESIFRTKSAWDREREILILCYPIPTNMRNPYLYLPCVLVNTIAHSVIRHDRLSYLFAPLFLWLRPWLDFLSTQTHNLLLMAERCSGKCVCVCWQWWKCSFAFSMGKF